MFSKIKELRVYPDSNIHDYSEVLDLLHQSFPDNVIGCTEVPGLPGVLYYVLEFDDYVPPGYILNVMCEIPDLDIVIVSETKHTTIKQPIPWVKIE